MMINNVLIVVPCLNEVLHIEGVLRQVFDYTLPDHHLVVVADGGSTDGTLPILARLTQEFPNLRVIHNAQRLQSAGVNLAVENFGATFDYLLRVDAHATYPAEYVQKLAKAIVEKGAQSVVVPLTSEGFTPFQEGVALAQNSVLGSGGSPHRHEGKSHWVDHGHHAMVDLAWFRRIGGYNPTFGYNEDAEMDVRLIRAGGKIWMAGDIPVIYYPRKDPVALYKQYFRYGGGRSQTVQMHKTPLKLRQMVPISIAPLCLIGLQAWTFWWLAIPALTWMFASIGFGVYLAIKHKSISGLLAGPAAMVMHVAWSAGYWRYSSFFQAFGRPPAKPVSVKGYDVLRKAMLIGQPVPRSKIRSFKARDHVRDFSVVKKQPSSVQ